MERRKGTTLEHRPSGTVTTSWEYDAMQRPTEIMEMDPDGEGPLDANVRSMAYTARGWLAS